MLIIIDAYNLLKQIIRSSTATQPQRDQFINIIKHYANLTNNKIILVFDGENKNYQNYISLGNITIVYSGYKKNADQHIKDLISNTKSSQMVIVTSDNKIIKFAHLYKITSIDSMAFYQLLKEKNQSNKETALKIDNHTLIKKTTENINPELDKLMKETSKFTLYKNEENIVNKKKGNSKKDPKKERDLLQILKKL